MVVWWWEQCWSRQIDGYSSGTDLLGVAAAAADTYAGLPQPAIEEEGTGWRQEVWARRQLMDNGHTVWQEAEWVGVILQQYGGGNAEMVRLVPWDLPIELMKYRAQENREPD